MGFTKITSGMDWQKVSFVNEFIKAFNERMPYRWGLQTLDLAPVVSGQDIQLRSFWRGIQNAVVNQWNNTISPYKSIDPIVAVDYPLKWIPEELIEPSYSYSDPLFYDDTNWAIFCDVNPNMHPDGFRRATQWDPASDDWENLNDPMFSYGTMERGDIIGPWIFKDLQTAIGSMKFRFCRLKRFFRGAYKEGSAVEYDDAVDDFNASSETSTNYLRVQATRGALFVGTGNERSNNLIRAKGRFSIWSDDNNPIPAVEIAQCGEGKYKFYPGGRAWGFGGERDIFDDNGDGVANEVYQEAITGDMGDVTDEFGSFEPPAQAPAIEGSGGSRGYNNRNAQGADNTFLFVELDGLEYEL